MYAMFQTDRRLTRPPEPSSNGFTLIELLVVIAILSVLLALAAPSFGPLIERWRVRQATEDLQATLYLARSEAVKRGGNVVVRKLPNGDGCTTASSNADWGCGWIVFYDTNNNGTLDADQTPPEVTLQRIGAPSGIAIGVAGSSGIIAVDRWGQFDSNASNDFTVRLIPQGKISTDPSANTLCIGAGGRIKRVNNGTATC